jgi:hypothetical protein
LKIQAGASDVNLIVNTNDQITELNSSALTPTDQISVVVYDDQLNNMIPHTPVLSIAEIAVAIANVRSGAPRLTQVAGCCQRKP